MAKNGLGTPGFTLEQTLYSSTLTLKWLYSHIEKKNYTYNFLLYFQIYVHQLKKTKRGGVDPPKAAQVPFLVTFYLINILAQFCEQITRIIENKSTKDRNS